MFALHFKPGGGIGRPAGRQAQGTYNAQRPTGVNVINNHSSHCKARDITLL